MRIFITGANGQLAKSIIALSPDTVIHCATKDDLDVSNKRQVNSQISAFKPDIVMHFASLTRGDECAKNPELAYKINVQGTQNVVDICEKLGAAILFVSTNEVFDGTKQKPYKERDKRNPITIAGKTKKEAEDIITKQLKKFFIIRTSWLFSQWSANFLQAVLNKARSLKKIELVDDEISSPTYSHDLAKAILQLIQTDKYGTYHLVNQGAASRLDFAKKAFEIYGVDNVEIIPIKLAKYPRLSKPPLFSVLENTKGAKLNIILPSWEEALTRFSKENKL